jgi:hypothetical protein
LPPEHPATGLQNNLIWKCHPLLDRAAASVQIGGYARTGRGQVPVAERDPITGALTPAL